MSTENAQMDADTTAAAENAAAPDPVVTDAAPVAQEPETDLDAFSKGADSATDDDGKPLKEPEPEPVKAETPAEPAAIKVDAKDKPEPDAKVEEEIKTLGLKERSAERFREMAGKLSELEPLRAKAALGDEWNETITSTGATPEQFGNALGYLQAINSGDPTRLKAVHGQLKQELAWLSKQIGEEAPDYDPLTEHADLADEVDNGDLTRKRALEIAAVRTREARAVEHTQRQTERQTQQTQSERAQQQAMADVAALNSELKAADPAFTQKLGYLAPTMALIRDNLPPEKWATAIREAYAKLPNVAAPAAPARPRVGASAQPIRPGSNSTNLRPTPKDDMEAFSMGVDSVAG